MSDNSSEHHLEDLMTKKYTNNIVEYAFYGIDDNIPSGQTTVVSVRDLLKIHATLEELIRFFHQPLHMQSLQDVEEYLGSAETDGALKLLNHAHSEIMDRMLPPDVDELFDHSVFDAPESPYYFKEQEKK